MLCLVYVLILCTRTLTHFACQHHCAGAVNLSLVNVIALVWQSPCYKNNCHQKQPWYERNYKEYKSWLRVRRVKCTAVTNQGTKCHHYHKTADCPLGKNRPTLRNPIGYEESNEGGEHPASKSTSRKTGVLRPAFSTKPTEPTAPINNTVTAIVCKRLRVRFFFMLLIFCCQS